MVSIKKIESKDIFRRSLIIGTSLLMVLLISSIATTIIEFALLSKGYSVKETMDVFYDTWSGYLINTVLSAICYTFPFLLIKTIDKRPVYDICSLNTPKNNLAPHCVGLVLGTAMVANIVTTVLNNIASALFDFNAVQQSIGDNTYSSSEELIYTLISAALLPALVEEFAFRGVVLGAFRKFGDMSAIFFSAIIFAVFHGNFIQMPFAFILGIVLGLTLVITGSIWPGIIAHFLNNAYAIVANATSQENYYLITMLFILIIVLGIISLAALCNKKAFSLVKKQPSTLSSSSKLLKMFISPTVLVFVILMLIVSFFSKA